MSRRKWGALRKLPSGSYQARIIDLEGNIQAKLIIVSYNNTYNSKSSSSKNKITLEQIEKIMRKKGSTKIKKIEHKAFSAGNTDFDNHLEYLFITEVI